MFKKQVISCRLRRFQISLAKKWNSTLNYNNRQIFY